MPKRAITVHNMVNPHFCVAFPEIRLLIFWVLFSHKIPADVTMYHIYST